MKNSILLILLTALVLSAQPRGVHRPDSTAVKYGASIGGSLTIDSTPTTATPRMVMVKGTGTDSNKVKQIALSALVPDSVRASRKADILSHLPSSETVDSFVIKPTGNDSLKRVGVSNVWAAMNVSDSINSTGMVWRTASLDSAWYQATTNNDGMVYGGGTFVTFMYTQYNSEYCAWTSTDGMKWYAHVLPIESGISDAAYGNGVFVGVNSVRYVITSVNSADWIQRNFYSPTTEQPSHIGFGNGRFLVVTGGDSVFTTDDGISWSAHTALAGHWQSVAYGNGIWMAVGLSTGTNKGMKSIDGGNTWSAQTMPTNNYKSLCFGNGRWVAISFNSGANYIDTCGGGSWGRSDTITNDNSYNDITYHNRYFVACGTDYYNIDSTHNIARSSDGIKWDVISTPSMKTGAYVSDLYSVASGNGILCVSVGYQGNVRKNILTSGEATNDVLFDAGVKTYRKVTVTDTIKYVSPTAGTSDSVAVVRGDGLVGYKISDSLDVDSSRAALISDSTKKNAPHGVTSGRYPVSAGGSSWSDGRISNFGNSLFFDSTIIMRYLAKVQGYNSINNLVDFAYIDADNYFNFGTSAVNGWYLGMSTARIFGTTVGNGYLNFSTEATANAMRITSAGLVGLNTTNPTGLLDIGGSIVFGSDTGFTAPATACAIFKSSPGTTEGFKSTGSIAIRTRVSSTDGRGSLVVYTGSPSLPRMRIKEDGGIKIFSPATATSASYLMMRDEADSVVKKITVSNALSQPIDSLKTSSLQVGSGTTIKNIHRRGDTLVVMVSTTDSLCFKAVSP